MRQESYGVSMDEEESDHKLAFEEILRRLCEEEAPRPSTKLRALGEQFRQHTERDVARKRAAIGKHHLDCATPHSHESTETR
jgi:hypothetical protein